MELEYRLRFIRPLLALSYLRQLKQLTLCFSFELLYVLAPMTNLEYLNLIAADYLHDHSMMRLQPIPDFSKLTSLSVDGGQTYSFIHVEVLSKLAGLCQLTLKDSPKMGAFRKTSHLRGLLKKLPQLAELGIPLQADNSVLRQVPAEKLSSLRILAVRHMDGMHAVSLLQRSTALTRLELHMRTPHAVLTPRSTLKTDTVSSVKQDAVVEAVACLNRLRSLVLCGNFHLSGPVPSPQAVLRALTGLTRLSIEQWDVTDDDLSACTGLVHLRELQLVWFSKLTAAAIPHLCNLTSLSYLEICEMRRDVVSGECVWARINDARRDRGWPPLSINCIWTWS